MRLVNPVRRRTSVIPALLLVAAAVVGCERGGGGGAASADSTHPGKYEYVGPPKVRTYPSSNATLQRWIAANDTVAIRQHGWDIWESITSMTTYGIPAWQTWYSGHEIFEESGETRARVRGRHGLVEFEVRPGFGHRPGLRRSANGGIPSDPSERVFAFNRFTQSTAEFIWKNGLNQGKVLRDTNDAFTRRGTPLISRAILTSADSTDSASFVLKPVFQFISGTEVTAVPYWSGDDSRASTDSANPIPSTWNRAVAVDPTGKLHPGDSVFLPVNNAGPMWMKVVPLSAFYWVKLTVDDSINFTQFGALNGDLIGVANDTSLQAVLNAARPGNIGLLMAMHVTGKEMPNWTWQSFWWGYDPKDPRFGADRPASIKAPWNHYNMTVAYSMTTPTGAPLVAYNPYLETSLAGKIPAGKDSLAWTGVTTNCMSCHRRAAIAWSGPVDTLPVPQLYGPAGLVNPADPEIFTQPFPGQKGRVPLLKTDFLWSVTIRGHTPPPRK
ncbi:MAG: hypothetical protein HY084_08220 [Gemmatimonadetes bacterium]|nr:hypothetical protein [Gemmatimonadota bacterium]